MEKSRDLTVAFWSRVIFAITGLLVVIQLQADSDLELTTLESMFRIEYLISESEFDQAKKLISKLKRETIVNPALDYHLARIKLKEGFYEEQSIVGYRYKQSSINAAVNLLNGITKDYPDYADAYSLLAHIYAIENDLDKAQFNLDLAYSFDPVPEWADFNQAIVFVKQHNYAQAYQSLKKIIDSARYINRDVYFSAWTLNKAFSVAMPEFDPNSYVRQKLYTRVLFKDLDQFIQNRKSQKPMFVYVTSDDRGCGYCAKNNHLMASVIRKYQSEIDFIYSSLEPWGSINSHPEITEKYFISGVPHSYIFVGNTMVSASSGLFESNGKLVNFVDTALHHVENDKAERFGHVVNKKQFVLLSYRLENLLQQYLKKQDYKAIAITTNDKGHYWRWMLDGEKDQKSANERAVSQCNQSNPNRRSLKKACRLFASGDVLIYDDVDKTTLKNIAAGYLRLPGEKKSNYSDQEKQIEVLANQYYSSLLDSSDQDLFSMISVDSQSHLESLLNSIRFADRQTIESLTILEQLRILLPRSLIDSNELVQFTPADLFNFYNRHFFFGVTSHSVLNVHADSNVANVELDIHHDPKLGVRMLRNLSHQPYVLENGQWKLDWKNSRVGFTNNFTVMLKSAQGLSKVYQYSETERDDNLVTLLHMISDQPIQSIDWTPLSN